MTDHLLLRSIHRAPLIFGHRGSPVASLENTLASYRRAFDDGADGIELDVRATADGVLVCHHDVTAGPFHRVSHLRHADLCAFYRRRRVEVPTLAETLQQLAGRGIINIELKIAGRETEAAALAQRFLPDASYLFSSFCEDAVAAFRRCAPQVPALLITRHMLSVPGMLRRLRALDASGLVLRHRLIDAHSIAFFHAHHMPVLAWTVNRLPYAQALAAMGVAGLITDFPHELAAAFKP